MLLEAHLSAASVGLELHPVAPLPQRDSDPAEHSGGEPEHERVSLEPQARHVDDQECRHGSDARREHVSHVLVPPRELRDRRLQPDPTDLAPRDRPCSLDRALRRAPLGRRPHRPRSRPRASKPPKLGAAMTQPNRARPLPVTRRRLSAGRERHGGVTLRRAPAIPRWSTASRSSPTSGCEIRAAILAARRRVPLRREARS